MAANLGLDTLIDELADLTGSATGSWSKLQTLLGRFRSDSTDNLLASAALKNAGTAEGELPLLGAGGLLPAVHLPAGSTTAAGVLQLATAADLDRDDLAVSGAVVSALLRERLLGFANLSQITSSGTFTPPAGVARVYAFVFAAGGGGGSGAYTARIPGGARRPSLPAISHAGGPGGLGGLAAGLIDVAPDTVYPVTVGAAGARGGTATDGGDSSFAGLSATGGAAGTTAQGGRPGSNGSTGANGTGSGGNYSAAIDATGPVRDFIMPRAQGVAAVDALFALFEAERATRRARDGSAAEAWSVDGAYWPGAGGAAGVGNGNNASGGIGGAVFIAY